MAKEPRILQILSETSDDEEPKATLETMARIQSDFGGDLTFMSGEGEDVHLDYDHVVTIAWRLAEQFQPGITKEEVGAKLRVEQIPDILEAFGDMIRIEIPEELQEEDAAEEGGTEVKN